MAAKAMRQFTYAHFLCLNFAVIVLSSVIMALLGRGCSVTATSSTRNFLEPDFSTIKRAAALSGARTGSFRMRRHPPEIPLVLLLAATT
jgi:hypothetical protein